MSKEITIPDENKVLVAFKPSESVTEYQVILDKDAATLWKCSICVIPKSKSTALNTKNVYDDKFSRFRKNFHLF